MNDTQALIAEIQALRERVELLETADVAPVVAVYDATGINTPLLNGVWTRVNFSTLLADTYNAVTTGASWVFTAPIPGYYHVSATATFQTVPSSRFELAVYYNGAIYLDAQDGARLALNASVTVPMAKNDTVSIWVRSTSTSIEYLNGSTPGIVSIHRILI